MTGINENVIPGGIGTEEQFTLRRSSSQEAYGNPYNPESLLSVGEDPLTAYDHRLWPDLATYKEAVAGRITPDQILKIAPRVAGLRETSYGIDAYNEPVRLGLDAENAGFTVIGPGFYIAPVGVGVEAMMASL